MTPQEIGKNIVHSDSVGQSVIARIDLRGHSLVARRVKTPRKASTEGQAAGPISSCKIW